MNRIRNAALVAAAGAALAIASPVMAGSLAGEAELRNLLQQQAEQLRQQTEQIRALNQRLAALEHAQEAGAGSAAVADPAQTQLAGALADTRQDDLAILQAQVAQLAATGTGNGRSNGNVSWRKGGPEFKSSDGNFSFHPRGRVVMDLTGTHGSAFDERNITGTDLASGRLGVEGEMGDLGYKLEADFAGNEVSLKDTYLSWDAAFGELPLELYVGNKLKDRSLDGASSGVSTPFMERNAVASVGAQQGGYYGLGLSARIFGDGWHASLTVTGDDVGNTGDANDSIAYLARAHWNPLKGGEGFVHLGAWYWYEHLSSSVDRINKASRVALGWNSQVQISAGGIDEPTSDHAYGLEVGGVYRSLWAFGEYTDRTIESNTGDPLEQKAASVYAGWLITGEKPGFGSRAGIWGTTRVLHPVTEGGAGAFELAARYDKYDFTDAARGGEGNAWTLGLNWYLNNWSRLMLNYVHWKTDNQVGAFQGPDSGNTLGIRTQVVF